MKKLIYITLLVCSVFLFACNSQQKDEEVKAVEKLETIGQQAEEAAKSIEEESKELDESLDELLKDME